MEYRQSHHEQPNECFHQIDHASRPLLQAKLLSLALPWGHFFRIKYWRLLHTETAAHIQTGSGRIQTAVQTGSYKQGQVANKENRYVT